MPTVHETALKEVVNQKMKDKGWCDVIATAMHKLHTGFYDPIFVDVIFQKFERFAPTIYDAYAFSQVWAMICSGAVVMARIGIGETPCSDINIDGNNAKLQTLWSPFSGEFWGGTQDEDGVIRVSKLIYLDSINPKTKKKTTRRIKGNFPLEVGYTSASKTLLALNGTPHRLARWPYGSEDIWLFNRADPAQLFPAHNTGMQVLP